MRLKINHITKRFQEKTAVDDFTLEFTQGVCGLIGENGAGKTTLMNMISSITLPTSGTISLDGVSTQKLGEDYRNLIGYLPQHFGVGREFTVIECLEYIASVKGLTVKEAREKTGTLMEQFSLTEYRKKRVCQLSGGTRRRVGIAQALLNDPKILILDEPTTGLDPGERARFRQTVSNLAKDRIVLISTHIVSDIEALSTRNAIMRKGKLAGYGTTDELVKPLLGKIWEIKLPQKEMDDFSQKHYVLSTRNSENGEIAIRFVGEEAVCGALPAHPQLEDIFLWKYLGGKGDEPC